MVTYAGLGAATLHRVANGPVAAGKTPETPQMVPIDVLGLPGALVTQTSYPGVMYPQKGFPAPL